MSTIEVPELLRRLTKDEMDAALTMGAGEARFLVDAYYMLQKDRLRAGDQVRALIKTEEPNAAMRWLFGQSEFLEDEIRRFLGRYAAARPTGEWALSVTGIGPVIAAGLLAHIDIRQAPSVGHIWRFAGLDPSRVWISSEKAKQLVKEHPGVFEGPESLVGLAAVAGADAANLYRLASTDRMGKPVKVTRETVAKALSKRPWNASLKTLCWKIGGSFVKQMNRESDVYGKVYGARKAQEIERNIDGLFADQAEVALRDRNFSRDTEARMWYAGCLTREAALEFWQAPSETRMGLARRLSGEPGSGVAMLPPGRLDERARRYAVKLFLSAYHEVAFFVEFAELPPKPYAVEHLGHVDYFGVPNVEVVPGFAKARAAAGL